MSLPGNIEYFSLLLPLFSLTRTRLDTDTHTAALTVNVTLTTANSWVFLVNLGGWCPICIRISLHFAPLPISPAIYGDLSPPAHTHTRSHRLARLKHKSKEMGFRRGLILQVVANDYKHPTRVCNFHMRVQR